MRKILVAVVVCLFTAATAFAAGGTIQGTWEGTVKSKDAHTYTFEAGGNEYTITDPKVMSALKPHLNHEVSITGTINQDTKTLVSVTKWEPVKEGSAAHTETERKG